MRRARRESREIPAHPICRARSTSSYPLTPRAGDDAAALGLGGGDAEAAAAETRPLPDWSRTTAASLNTKEKRALLVTLGPSIDAMQRAKDEESRALEEATGCACEVRAARARSRP